MCCHEERQMKRRIFPCLVLALSNLVGALTVWTLDEQLSQANQTVFRFKIENHSGDTLNGIEIRYHVIQDTSLVAEPELYYLPGGMANWSFEDSVGATLVIYFPDAILYPGDTLGGNSGYAVGLHNKDWSTWTKGDDPSQPTSREFSMAENMDVLSGGKSLMLDAGKSPGCPVVQFVETGKDTISLQVLRQLYSDSTSVILANGNGVSISADLNDAATDSFGHKIWRGYIPSQDSAERRGEWSVVCGGNLLAYFAYGWKPTGAQTAVAKKLWESADSFVKADFDMGFNQGLVDGQRLSLQKDSSGKFLDARHVENWKFYRAWEEPGENPMPVVLSSILQYEENGIDSLALEWSPVGGVDWYRLLVIRVLARGDSAVFADTAVSMFTAKTAVKIPVLQTGDYVWLAEPLVETSVTENEGGEEYFYITGDDAVRQISGNSPLSRSLFKKFKKWAKKTVKRATKYAAPVVYSAFYGGNVVSNTWSSFKSRANPFGVIQIFVHKETLHARTNSVTKNMEWLQWTYVSQNVYTAYEAHKEEYLKNGCFGTSAFCAMKDTRMLADNWNVGFNSLNWNKVFPKLDWMGDKSNSAVQNRCWLTMAQMLNHHKGGDISEDEILYKVRGGFGNADGGGPVETMQAVNYALNQGMWNQVVYTSFLDAYKATGALPLADGWYAGSPAIHAIVVAIESGNVLGVSQLNGGANGAHSMVLDGYKIQSDGGVYIHLLNTDNMGSSEWRYYGNISFLGLDVVANLIGNGVGALIDALAGTNIGSDLFFSYYVPPLHAHGRSSNASIFIDSDGDGIVDMDETERLQTNPQSADSDGDGIPDYEEILDYKKCETYSDKFMPYVYATTDAKGKTVYHSVNEPQISFVLQSDFDGDGLHVAMDRDSDGDGFCDNQEAGFLGNGFAHNCDRFDAAKHPDGVVPNCKDFSVALLSAEKLQMNDRAGCVAQNGGFCPVASYGESFDGDYGVRLGVDAFVGNVYSAKSVLMRDRSAVYGNLETGGEITQQSSTTRITGTVVSHSAVSGVNSAYYANLMDFYSANTDFSVDFQKNVDAGELFRSGSFGADSKYTGYNFNSNSDLKFDKTGEFNLGALEFQSGSRFLAPAESVIFHVGENFQWNGIIVADDMISAAKHIMVYYHGTNRVFIQTDFAGTIIAPNAEVVVGQSGKNFTGAIYAKSIVVHQNAKITWVPFVPNSSSGAIAGNNNGFSLDDAVALFAE